MNIFIETYIVTGLQTRLADVSGAGEVDFNFTWKGNRGVPSFQRPIKVCLLSAGCKSQEKLTPFLNSNL